MPKNNNRKNSAAKFKENEGVRKFLGKPPKSKIPGMNKFLGNSPWSRITFGKNKRGSR